MELGIRWVGFCVAMGAALACGRGDDGWTPTLGGNQPPVIEHLRVEHDDPEALGDVRAVIEARDPDGDVVEVAYEWTVGGVVLPEAGPMIELPRSPKGTRVEVVATARDDRVAGASAKRVIHLRNPRPVPDPDMWRTVRPDGEGARPADGRAQNEISRGDRPDTASNSTPAAEAVHYAVQVPFEDTDGGIRFRMLEGPEGMWVHPASGEVTWVPEAWQTGSHSVEVEITNGKGEMMVESFDVDSGFAAANEIAAIEPESLEVSSEANTITAEKAVVEPVATPSLPANLDRF
jgi:hypothetical protein